MLTPLCRRRSSHLQRSRSTTPEIRRCHTPQHEAQISMLQRPRRVRPLLPPLGRAVFVGKSRHSRPALTTHLRHLSGHCRRLSVTRVMLTDTITSCFGMLQLAAVNRNIFGSFQSQTALLHHKNLQTPKSRPRRNRETLRCENPSSAQPATLAKSSSSQPGQQAPPANLFVAAATST